MLFSKDSTCLTDDEAYNYKQTRSKPPLSRAESKLLDLIDFIAGFFIWMSSAGQESASPTLQQGHDMMTNRQRARALLQGLHGLLGAFLPDAERLNPGLLDLLQGADLADVRVRRVPGAELAGPDRGPGTFGVVPGAGVAPGAGGEDGRLDGFRLRDGDVEDEFVFRRGHLSFLFDRYSLQVYSLIPNLRGLYVWWR